MKEEWKYINGFESRYMISSFGRIKSLKNDIILRKRFQVTGYEMATLCKAPLRVTKRVHRIVAEHFIDNKINYEQVNHKDGNKKNNNSNNLEWVTRKMNTKHAVDNNLYVGLKIKVSDEIILKIREEFNSGKRQCDIAEEFTLQRPFVSMVVKNLSRTRLRSKLK